VGPEDCFEGSTQVPRTETCLRRPLKKHSRCLDPEQFEL